MTLPLPIVQVIIVGSVMTLLAMITLGLRLWSRRIQGSPLAFNDYMAITAMISTIGTISTCLSTAFLGGYRINSEEFLANKPWASLVYFKLLVVWQLLWAAADTSVKLSILLLYVDLFPSNRFCYLCYGTIFASVAYFAAVFLETFLLCKPIEYNWDKMTPGGKCANQNLAYIITCSINLAIDAFIVALPMPMLFGLQMSLRRRLSIAGMFSLGIVICILSLLRTFTTSSWGQADTPYTNVPIAFYSILGPSLGVIDACLPTVKPALHRICGTGPFRGRRLDSDSTDEFKLDPNQNHQYSAVACRRGVVHIDDNVRLTYSQARSGLGADMNYINGITVIRTWNIDNYPNTAWI